jgi:CHAT domain-containing protein
VFAGRPPAARALAVLADPVFAADDPRVARPAGAAGAAGAAPFRRLPFTRAEAEALAALAPAGAVTVALDFAAARPAAAGLAGHRLVHFATHAVLDDAHPELSGLVLSLVDERGAPRDGFLRLLDIYNLRLNAELVSLSACDTARGREVRGEGLVGLARGFFYAGAERVLASLWRVEDRATAELMRRFYRGVLGEGQRPAAALRAAQVSMLGEERWRAPYHWAAFVLQGEWR